jgi:hypothetical protein
MNEVDYFFSMRPAFPWSAEPLGLPALAVVATLIVLFTIWTYLGHPQTTRRRMFIILTLRILALIVALLTALRPSLGVNENPKQPSTLIIGVDVSESMTVKDEIAGQSRGEAVRKMLEKCQPILDELYNERAVSVVMYKFGLPDFSEATSRYDLTTPFDAKRSDYGTYLNKTDQRFQAERVRAHLVIGDGADNGETFTPETEAVRWGRRGVPIHTFRVGKESSTGNVKDLAVTSVECNPSPGFIKNDVVITARVNAYNFPNARVTARVFFDDNPVHTEDFTLEREKNNELKMTAKLPEKKGEIKVKVQVGILEGDKLVPLPGELSPLNNWSETYLTVQKEGVRILIIDQLRWEETFLRDAFRGEKRFDVYHVILQNDNTIPEAAKQYMNLEEQAFDVVIIGNVDAARLNRAAPRFLADLTKLATTKGIGVMFLGGEYAYNGIDKDLLPITGGPIIDKLDARGNPTVTYPAIPTSRGLEKMFKVSPKAETTKELWDRMNNFRTGYRLNGYNKLTLRPGGIDTVYAWTTDAADPQAILAGGDPKGDPLLVGSQRGDANKGRWLAFAAFDTYFWRRMGLPDTFDGIQMHERFWRQCVLWLAHQDEEEGQVYARPQFRQMKVTGEQTLRVGYKKPDGTDDPTAPLTVRILPLAPGLQEPKAEDEKKASPQTILTDKDGRKVLFRPTAPGEYFVSVTSPAKKADGTPELNADGTPKLYRATAKFIAVPDVSDEMLRVNADADFLTRLAVPNGGKALLLEDLPTFLRELKAEAPLDIGKKPRFYPDWNRNRSRGFLPFWLVVFALLLGGEWALRRYWGMI